MCDHRATYYVTTIVIGVHYWFYILSGTIRGRINMRNKNRSPGPDCWYWLNGGIYIPIVVELCIGNAHTITPAPVNGSVFIFLYWDR